MALARSWYSAVPKSTVADASCQRPEADERGTDPSMEHSTEANVEADDTESLASFIASEFSGLSPSSFGDGRTARQRRSAAAAHADIVRPVADMLGAASS